LFFLTVCRLPSARDLIDAAHYIFLLLLRLFGLLAQFLQTLLSARLTGRVESPPGLFHSFESAKRLSLRFRAVGILRRRLGALHLVCGSLHLLRAFGKPGIAPLARQFFKLAGKLARFLYHFLLLSLRASSASALLLLLLSLSLFELLLLSPGKLLEPTSDLILLLILLLLLAALKCLVLIFHLVELQLEKIGKLLFLLTALALALASRNLDFAEYGFGAKQLLQRSLFRRESVLRLAPFEYLGRRLHLLRRLCEVLDDLCELRLSLKLIAQSSANSLGQRVGIAAQFLLA
jgi:hypothetical protein